MVLWFEVSGLEKGDAFNTSPPVSLSILRQAQDGERSRTVEWRGVHPEGIHPEGEDRRCIRIGSEVKTQRGVELGEKKSPPGS